MMTVEFAGENLSLYNVIVYAPFSVIRLMMIVFVDISFLNVAELVGVRTSSTARSVVN